MNDIQQQDKRLFFQELLRPSRVLIWNLLTALSTWFFLTVGIPFGFAFGFTAVWFLSSYSASINRRFIHRRFQLMWEACSDRLDRFHMAVQQMRKNDLAEFTEMPRTIGGVGHSLYFALRRADLVFREVSDSEGWMVSKPDVSGPPHPDAQARELYRIADKNIADYKHQLTGVLAGIQRTEAQAAVFTTTLDTLRVKMLSYRLTGRRPELSSQDFLESLSEAKMQLEAIDKALDELELSPFPRTISVMPPAIPSDANRPGRD